MPVLLGKDCVISGGGLDNACVRDVTYTVQAKEVEVHPIGGRQVIVWNSGYTFTVEVEFLGTGSGSTSEIFTGDTVTISGGGFSGTMVVTGVQRSEPLDGPVTYRVQFKGSA